ncbi:hypothetical protein BC629DRAFT_1592651 [Irpex lacteus]|nr:hypothetical protein BC629DRAFT_1592651 [Irpex lacteus]
MPALFNFLFCHKTPRRPRTPAPRVATRPFSPVVFARFSESSSTEPDLSVPNSRFIRKSVLFSISPVESETTTDLLEASYSAPSTSSFGDPIIAPPSIALASTTPTDAVNTTHPISYSPPMPNVIHTTPVNSQAFQGYLGSIQAECWLFYVSPAQLQALEPQAFLNICSDAHPAPGIRYRLEQFLEVDGDATGRVMWAQAWDHTRPLAFLIFQLHGVPPSDRTLGQFGLDRSCLPDSDAVPN